MRNLHTRPSLGWLNRHRFRLSLLAVLVLYVALAVPFVTVSAGNIRLLDTFSSDEPFVVETVKCMIDRETLVFNDCTDYQLEWPRLSFFLLMGVAFPARAVLLLDVNALILLGRFLSALMGLLAVSLTFLLAARLFGSRVALLAGILLSLSPVFLQWSLTIHPDVIQAVFVLIALLYSVKVEAEGRVQDVLLACLFAGLAFSTKYIGAFLLPAIGLALLLNRLRSRRQGTPGGWWSLPARVIRDMALGCAVFLAVFVICTPEIWSNPDTISRSLALTGWGLTNKGIGGSTQRGYVNPIAWLQTISSPAAAGLMVSLLAVIGAALSVLRSSRWSRPRRILPISALSFAAGAVLFLLLRVTYVVPVHFLSVVPVVVTLAAYAMIRLLDASRSWTSRVRVPAVVGLLLIVVGDRGLVTAEFMDGLQGRATAPEAIVGDWVAQNFPLQARILYDQYVYVPPQFVKTKNSWGMSHITVEKMMPDLIISSRRFSERRYLEEAEQQSFVGNAALFTESRRFYEALRRNDLPGYDLALTLDYIEVYARDATVGLAGFVRSLRTKGAVHLPVGSRQIVAPFLDPEEPYAFWENERSLVFPLNAGQDSCYIMPAEDPGTTKRFEAKWAAFMNRVDDSRSGLHAFCLEADRLSAPDTAQAWLQRPGFPVPPHVVSDIPTDANIRLSGYRIETETVSRERPLKVILFWHSECSSPCPRLKTSVELVGQDGGVKARTVEDPVGGGYPTDRWRQGDLILDRVTLPLSNCNLGPEDYLIVQLMAEEAPGIPAGDRSARLGPLRLKVEGDCVSATPDGIDR